ncbi:MAG: hypothetical protein OXO52_08600 [Rhodospirillales bacterium]|nr:hypothetical protein [Rhodospirillales bacterium]MDE0379994.1 hypothetical protein [Rhodospirillales bacterium]
MNDESSPEFAAPEAGPKSAPGGTARAELLLPSRDLHADLAFFRERLGFRLESIFPADDPAQAVLSGHGARIRLERGGAAAPGTIRLHCEDPDGFGNGARELHAPGGTRIELRDLQPRLQRPPTRHAVVVQRQGADDSLWGVGRAGMHYRDLIPGRLGGAIIASHIRIPDAGPVPDDVHYHIAAFQLIYCYRGWVNLVYEDQGPPFRLEAGDCLIQPPQIRHRVLESSAGLEVIEIAVPAEHLTALDHTLALPTGHLRPQRDFGGQRFLRHRARDAVWGPARLPGFSACDTGIAAATGSLASAQVARRNGEGGDTAEASHDADILFTFVLEGGMTLRTPEHEACALRAGDAFVLPPGLRNTYELCSDDLALLEVSLPGAFETTIHRSA